MNEALHALQWLVPLLRDDSTLDGLGVTGAYNEVIPEDVALPAIRLSLRDSRDVRVVGQARVITHCDWLVVVTTQGLSMTAVIPIADRIDTLLHGVDGVRGETATVNLESFRLEPFQLMELEESGIRYRHTGGLYRTIVYAK